MHDSAVSKGVNYDLIRAVEKITKEVDREGGLGVELLGQLGGSGVCTPRRSPKSNGVMKN